ncbi:efflux RND transporter permease subunit [uncultured Microscilla sp.]|uniref:efflux RND transporter permease subunit n=1 Tax=uncultured Microscilla sp. TaxID=432653 RepID=UPI0026019D5B|nr:efflux RND transporter permease subunit [uncultured Microscilla sp.]
MSKEKNNKLDKEFKLTSLSVDNRTSVMILAIIIIIFGLISYVQMPKESYPEIVIPNIYVGTPYPGNSPNDMESLVTRPIEKELKSLTGVKKISSTSIQGYSTVIVEFNPDVAIPKALQDVKDAVDKAKSELPTDLPVDPNVSDINLSDLPIMYVNVASKKGGKKYKREELKVYAEYLEDEFEKLSQISKVDIKGIQEREVRIDVDLFKLEGRMLNFNDIANAIRQENVTVSGGDFLADDFRKSIRIVNEFESMDDIRNVIIKNEDGNIVYLRDVAQVRDSYKEPTSFARSSGNTVVTLNVSKRSGENLLIAADEIKQIIKDAQDKKKLPADLDISITNDQSRDIKSMVSNLQNSIISGVILVVAVLLFFMGLRSALFVGIAIPLSMFISFILLGTAGVTMNMMVLFSLILALGMLVDNGIVVIENIYRLLQEGYPLKRAVKEGVGEIALPIIASTATTVIAFLPLAFWGGIMGQFMRFLPITLIVVLSASLIVALVINPAIAMIFAKLDDGKNHINKRWLIIAIVLVVLSIPAYFVGNYTLTNLLGITGSFILLNMFVLTPVSRWFQNKALVVLENGYSRIIRFALGGAMPYILLVGTIFLFVFSIMLVGISGLKVRFFPDNEPNYVNIFIQKPIGTDIKTTNEFTKKVEDRIMTMMKPYDFMVDAIIAQVGEGTSDPNEGPQQGSLPHKAKVAVSFADFQDRRGVQTSHILEEIRAEMKKYPGALITVSKDANGPNNGPPINIEISSENYAKLADFSEELRKYLIKQDIPGVEELKSDLQTGKPELLVNIDREKARSIGLSTNAIASEIRTALFGAEVSKFKDGEDDYKIQVRLKDEQRYDLGALLNKSITFRNNKGQIRQIPISSVASVNDTSSLGSVKRKDLDRVITIFSNVKEGYNANEIVATMKGLINDYEVPDGIDKPKFTGEQEEQQKSAEFLMMALLLAVFGVFLIIVTQFNSLSAPLVIMSSVLFSTIGVFLGLVIFRMEFVILMTGIGIISLAGVVVNNAIVLIDYTNLLRSRRKVELGMDEEDHLPNSEFLQCIAEAGKKRLRPVLLTAITTVLGLIPLAVGFNIDFFGYITEFKPNIYFGGSNTAFWGPMSWTVIFGLTFATFLTLVIVPVMYLLTDRLKFSLRRLFGLGGKKMKEESTPDKKSESESPTVTA